MLLLLLRVVMVLAMLFLACVYFVPAGMGIGLFINPEMVRGQLNPTDLDNFRLAWVEIALLLLAGLMFVIAAIRLVRRTQSFLAFLLGFAAIAGFTVVNAWLTVQADPTRAGIPGQVLEELSGPAPMGVLGLMVFVGIVIFFIDRTDKAHWRHVGRDG
jgi:di/tricarboxylate transporter